MRHIPAPQKILTSRYNLDRIQPWKSSLIFVTYTIHGRRMCVQHSYMPYRLLLYSSPTLIQTNSARNTHSFAGKFIYIYPYHLALQPIEKDAKCQGWLGTIANTHRSPIAPLYKFAPQQNLQAGRRIVPILMGVLREFWTYTLTTNQKCVQRPAMRALATRFILWYI